MRESFRSMGQPSSFSGFEPPISFDFSVRGRLAFSRATVELHEYRFAEPQRQVFQSRRSFLDLALSHRPGCPRGCYIDEPQLQPQPIGDILFVPARQGLRSDWGPGPQRSVCCEFDFEERTDWTSAELRASLDVRSPIVRQALLLLAAEIEQPSFGSAILAEALCTQIEIGLERYFRQPPPDAPVSGQRFSSAYLRRIDERLDLPGPVPNVSELAAELDVSPRQFFRMFRSAVGMTLGDYAAQRRIERAKHLLSVRVTAIKQVAWQCGFETPAAFSAAFRRATGYSPTDYRNMTAA